MKLGDQDKPWVPLRVCCICVEELRQWSQRKKQSFQFGIPMIWRETKKTIVMIVNFVLVM